MGCGCQGGKGSAPPASAGDAFMLVYPDGRKEYFATELAARSANQKKADGSGLVKRNR